MQEGTVYRYRTGIPERDQRAWVLGRPFGNGTAGSVAATGRTGPLPNCFPKPTLGPGRVGSLDGFDREPCPSTRYESGPRRRGKPSNYTNLLVEPLIARWTRRILCVKGESKALARPGQPSRDSETSDHIANCKTAWRGKRWAAWFGQGDLQAPNLIERCVEVFKQYRCVATRYHNRRHPARRSRPPGHHDLVEGVWRLAIPTGQDYEFLRSAEQPCFSLLRILLEGCRTSPRRAGMQ